MASHRIPANPVALYWVYWAPFKRLVDFPTTYNMIFLFHAYPANGEATGGNTGAVVLRTPSGTIGSNLNADIATCRARGQKIIVSVGGAGGQVYLTSQARADAFVTSIKAMNVTLGGSGTTLAFDGIDWNNFEGVQQGSQGTWMTYIGQQLRAYYGDSFIFTSPPAGYALPGGAQVTSDRLLLAELYQGGVLDWLCPQFYDPSNLNTVANVRLGLTHYHTAVTVNGSSVQIPQDYIGIGFSLAAVASTSRWSPSGAASCYTTIVNEGYNPKGAFNWANHEDTGDSFATTVAPVITNNTESTPAFQLSASSQFTNGAVTTAQLIAPLDKTSGADFQAGSINESSNPAASLNLSSGKYTELEWCIQATSAAVNGQQYEFRVTYNGTALDDYGVVPKWTIGTPVTTSTDPTPPPNDTGGYLNFDGNGDYVYVPDNAAYSVPTTGELTISAWIRPNTLNFSYAEDASSEGHYVHWLQKGDYNASAHEWAFRMYSNDGTRPNRISFYVFNSGGGTGVGSYFEEVVNTGDWIHVVGKVDATSTYIYKNGVLKDSDVYTASITPANTAARIGIGAPGVQGSTPMYFEGAIDDVCIWNRALTSNEIASLYTGTVSSTGLVGRWKLDDGSGNTATDSSATANNGTLQPGTGSPAWVVTSSTPAVTRSITGITSITGLTSITL